jgi:hypothetical protein
MSDRANVFAIHSWAEPEICYRFERLLRETDPGLAHYSVPPDRAIDAPEGEVIESLRHRIAFATSVVVLNTPGLHKRPWSNLEMRIAVEMQKRIVVVQPPENFYHPIPSVVDGNLYRVAPFRADVLGRAIRGEYPQDERVFDLAEAADRRSVVGVISAAVATMSLAVLVESMTSFSELQRDVRNAGLDLRWQATDTSAVVTHAIGGAVLAGGLAVLLTGDSRAGWIAAAGGALAGGALGAQKVYHAALLGTSQLRILTLDPI